MGSQIEKIDLQSYPFRERDVKRKAIPFDHII